MKRSLFLPLVCLALASGCGDDDNPLTPGDPADPNLATYLDQYEGLVGFTALQMTLPIQVVELIYSTAPTAASGLRPLRASGLRPLQEDYTIHYNETTKYWVVSTMLCPADPDTTICFSFLDSLQLRQGGIASQYPDSVTSIQSFLTVQISGTDVDHGEAYQNLTYTLVTEDPTVIRANGHGGLDAALTVSDSDSAGVTNCDLDLDLSITVDNILIAFDSACPTGGRLVHSGPTSVDCTGGHPASLSGSWSATETYDPQGFVVTGDGKRWELELDCNLFGGITAPILWTGPLAAAPWRNEQSR